MSQNSESQGLALGGAAGAASTGTPGPPQTRPTLTKQLSMEQETRAVRLMVAGGLGQHTCPRSRCAARQCRTPAASRLRARQVQPRRPGGKRAGGGASARLPRASPLLSTMELARLRPPARARKGGEPDEGSAPGRARRGRGGGSSRPRPRLQAPPSSRSPPAACEGVLRGRLGAFAVWAAGLPPDRVRG